MRESTSASGRLIRLVIVDDNPFLAFPDGTIRPRAATFHRFAEGVVAAGPFEPGRYLVPVSDAHHAPGESDLPPVDPARLQVIRTAPFDGIAGYLSHLPWITLRNWSIFRRSIADADLVWIKAPASNGLLALVASRRSRRPSFTWVAGSARAVVRGQRRSGPNRLIAEGAAAAYDAITGVLRRAGPAIDLDESLFTSVVTADEVAATRTVTASAGPEAGRTTTGDRNTGPLRLAWAGRMVADKGIEDLLVALATVRARGLSATLELIGDGPERGPLQRRTSELGLDGAVTWHGYLGRRDEYLNVLRGADLFVLPSRAEGVPKVILEAMAAGLPVVTADVGAIPALLDHGRLGRLVAPGDPVALAAAIAALEMDAAERARLRLAGLDFAAIHTIERQAQRVVAWMQRAFPGLPWPDHQGAAA